MQDPEQNLLADFETNLEQAGAGKRLANYLIDLIFYYIIIFFVIALIVMPGTMTAGETSVYTRGFSLPDRLLFLVLYGLYMFLVEILFKGKSLGKLITGTRAVNEDGSSLTAKTAFLRGLSRAVPFEPFSALGSPSRPWHDRWTRTYVIDEKHSRRG